jgi:folate-binding protein YgfZ
MNPAWQAFLISKGATIKDGSVDHFGDPQRELRAARHGVIVSDLSHFGLIRFSGPDTQAFLQGQTTKDVKRLGPNASQYGAHCTPKGRVFANFLLWQRGDDYYMELPALLAEPTRRRFNKYVLRSKVALADVSDNWVCVGVAGPNASPAVEKLFGRAPQPHETLQYEGCKIMGLPGFRFAMIALPDQAIDLWQALLNEATPVGATIWGWHDIRAGIPWITAPTQEQFLPQMLNMDLIGAVSFSKGCYPGQEIVARAHYLGNLKRRMYLANVVSETALYPGDELFASDGGAAGIVVNAAPSPDGGTDVLAVIQIASVETGSVRTQDNALLRFLPLPYSTVSEKW